MPTPTTPSTDAFDEWRAQRANTTRYLKRGQVESLFAAIGISRHKLDDIFPDGCEAKKRLPRVHHALYVRRVVLQTLGVSD
jgi:hypothetical protein